VAGALAPSTRVPRIPEFSGEGRKQDVEFDVWKYDVKSLMRSFMYPEHVLLESIRNSLKGKARSVLVHLGEGASPNDILLEIEAIFGNVSTGETLKEKFYSARQESHETVADFSIRLEHLLSNSNVKLSATAKNEMLRSRLWSGLRNKELRNAARYKFESIKSFSLLRKEIRKIEQELEVGVAPIKVPESTPRSEAISLPKEVAASNMTLVESKLLKQVESLVGMVRGLNGRMDSMEKELKELKQERQDSRDNAGGSYKNDSGKGHKKPWYHIPKGQKEESKGDLNGQGPPQKKGQ